MSCEELLEDVASAILISLTRLGLTYPIREEFAAFAERARSGGYSTEELVSRGEYFTASPDGRVPGACRSWMPRRLWRSITTVRSA